MIRLGEYKYIEPWRFITSLIDSDMRSHAAKALNMQPLIVDSFCHGFSDAIRRIEWTTSTNNEYNDHIERYWYV